MKTLTAMAVLLILAGCGDNFDKRPCAKPIAGQKVWYTGNSDPERVRVELVYSTEGCGRYGVRFKDTVRIDVDGKLLK